MGLKYFPDIAQAIMENVLSENTWIHTKQIHI